MKITKREARKRFEQGEDIYCYPRQAKTEYDYIDYEGAGFRNPLKPIMIRKYDETFEFDEQVAFVERHIGNGIWFSVCDIKKECGT